MKYVVVGGVAVVLHGIVRLTVDLDLMIDLKQGNTVKFLDVMPSLGYKPKAPVYAVEFLDPARRALGKRRRTWSCTPSTTRRSLTQK